MPRTSERQDLVKQLDEMIKVLAAMDEDEDLEELCDMRAALLSCRYLNLRSHVRKNKTMNQMLWFYGDREFKQVVRMSVDSFLRLIALIKDDVVFQSCFDKGCMRAYNCVLDST